MTPLKTRDEYVAEHTARVQKASPLYANQFRKAYAGQCSPRAAIKAKCLDCCNLDRAEIADCLVYTCPLWLFRPYQINRQKLRGTRLPPPVGQTNEF